ncbi:MAG: hypothetical protein ABT01_00590 [Clostridium sp. SCN 57-10]|nr:MAG: hypothetical protein ABT01_00590 [Clostridium sp. SCN 57-10]
MNDTTIKLTGWAIEKIKTEYPQDVALLVAVKGHSTNGDGHGECFDYFVPATERGKELSQTFIIDGVGHDLYPRTWERTERTAALDDWATTCLSNAEILYSRTPKDVERFEEIRRTLYRNLENREFMYRKALEKLDMAMNLYRTMMFESAPYKLRMAAGYIADYLSRAVAYLNGTFFQQPSASQIAQVEALPTQPEGFAGYCRAVIAAKTGEELKALAWLLIDTTRRFAAAHKPERKEPHAAADFANLADWYQELCLTWRRLRYYCDLGDSEMAFDDACNLQSELLIVGEEFGLREMDLLGVFDAADLKPLSERSDELERYIVSEIEGHGVVIRRYHSVDEFLSHA